MTRDQQKSITEFIVRVVRPDQSAIDVEADAIIRALLVRNPDAAYRVTLLAMAQEAELKALHEAKLCSAVPVQAKSIGNWLSGVLRREDRHSTRKTGRTVKLQS